MYWFPSGVEAGGQEKQSPSLIGSYQSIIWANQQGNQELLLRLMIKV
jgi:hypothetical protein